MWVGAGPIAAFEGVVAPPLNREIPRTWVIGLVLAAGLLLYPFVGWVVLAIWLSGFARGLHDRITHRLHGRVHLAAFLTCLLLTLVLVPIGIVLTVLVIDAIALIADLAQSDRGHSVLVTLVSSENPNPDASIKDLILAQGDRALGIAKTILSSMAQIVIGLVIIMMLIIVLIMMLFGGKVGVAGMPGFDLIGARPGVVIGLLFGSAVGGEAGVAADDAA